MKVRKMSGVVAMTGVLIVGGAASAANELIINEFNCVADDEHLGGSNGCDPEFCREEGNGGNWIELVVVQNNLDIRGWVIQWSNADGTANYGTITFQDHALWQNLPAGLIITIVEPQLAPLSTPAADTSYNTGSGDWNINVHSSGLGSNVYIQVAGHFKVDNDNWRVRIINPGMRGTTGSTCESWTVVQECIGEGITGWGGGGINSEEGGQLRAAPGGGVTVANYFDTTYTTLGCPNTWGHAGATRAPANYQDFTGLRTSTYTDNRCGHVVGGFLVNTSWYERCFYATSQYDCEIP